MTQFTKEQIAELKKQMDEQALQQRLAQAETTANTLLEQLGPEAFAKMATILKLASGAGHRNNMRAIQALFDKMATEA